MAINWMDIDWSRPTAVLARALGVSKQAVQARRRQHAPDTRGGGGLTQEHIDFLRGKMSRLRHLQKLAEQAMRNKDCEKDYRQVFHTCEADIRVYEGILGAVPPYPPAPFPRKGKGGQLVERGN